MEEKTMIKSEHYNSILVWILPIIAALIVAIRFGTWSIRISHPIWFIVWGIALLGILIYWWLGKMQLTVTDKRVYGKATFGKRVDLPLDSISVVGTSALWGIDVGTSSGRIHFKLVKNKDAIHSELSKLLMERQGSAQKLNVQTNRAISNADELRKYKDLLDSGVISQEEFDTKKKQLLGL